MKYLFSLIVVCLTASINAQSWTLVQLKNDFIIKMPCEPKIQQIDPSRKSYGCAIGNCTYSVLESYLSKERLPENSGDEQRILSLVSGVEKAKLNNTFVSEANFKVGTISGLEVIKFTQHPTSEIASKMISRSFFTKDVLYQVTCLYYNGEDSACDKNRKIFFNSFTRK